MDQIEISDSKPELDGQTDRPAETIQSRKASYGSMKHTLLAPVGDLITPVDADWEVLR